MRTASLFESERLTLDAALDLSCASLAEYGPRYDHWAIAYSGGKDSTATLAFVLWSIQSGRVPHPARLSVLYADTRMELPPLQQAALNILEQVRAAGWEAQAVLPRLDDRFYVYMLGLGVPPPKNRFRWCTPQLKVEPMQAAIPVGALTITGVRLGESAARDQRIAVSCSRDTGECGQGWFQQGEHTLAPLLHWRLCHVFDWLYFDNEKHGLDTSGIAAVYGDDDIRTGCVGCNLASRDNALERLLRQPAWAHLAPLLELKPLYAELTMAKWRKRKVEPELRQDGQWSQNVQRMGPLTMAGRAYGLDRVLAIQQRARVDLVNSAEEARIRALWAADAWPRRWSAADINADVMIDAKRLTADGIATQNLLVR